MTDKETLQRVEIGLMRIERLIDTCIQNDVPFPLKALPHLKSSMSDLIKIIGSLEASQ